MNGNIPVINIRGISIADAWEKSLVKLYEQGCEIKTQYDNPNDPPSKDCTAIIEIENPLAEPMIHRGFPAGLEDLQEYTMEVCDGIKNDLIDPESETKWHYTYHSRMTSYECIKEDILDGDYTCPIEYKYDYIDQIENLCQSLSKSPYSRRAQISLWRVDEDSFTSDPPCLQSIWCRILPDENDIWTLNTNLRIRSNDAYRAGFMNMFAFTMLQRKIAIRIAEIAKRFVKVGRYVHIADSYHIYGSNMEDFKKRFLRIQQERKFEDRVYNYCDVKEMMDNAVSNILEKVEKIKNNA